MMVWNDNQPIQPVERETLASEGQQSGVPTRKPFIEPAISSPVDGTGGDDLLPGRRQRRHAAPATKLIGHGHRGVR